MSTKDKVSIIFKTADAFQDECHKVAELILKENPKTEYQDATNVWIFRKLAELQFHINELENKPLPISKTENKPRLISAEEKLKSSGKPWMNLAVRISQDSAQNQRFTEEEIKQGLYDGSIIFDDLFLMREKDGAVVGEVTI